MKAIRRNLALMAVTALSTQILPGRAAANDLTAGIAAYNSGKYAVACSMLEKAARSKPYDATTHYYLGLAYQAQKQSTMANQQFQWVAANSPNPTLKAYAARALGASSTVHTAGSVTQSAQSFPSASAAGSSSAMVSAQTAAPKPRGRCKVMMFETSWCHVCHAFSPHFDEMADKNRSRMDFEHINAEDPNNADLKAKYGIHSYPHLVYVDGSGTLLYNEGANMFDRRVKELTGS